MELGDLMKSEVLECCVKNYEISETVLVAFAVLLLYLCSLLLSLVQCTSGFFLKFRYSLRSLDGIDD